MTELANWLEDNKIHLIEAMTATLSDNVMLQSQVAQAVEAFFGDFTRAAHSYSATPLYNTLLDWVEDRSSPTEEDTSSLMPVLARLKETINEQIITRSQPAEALTLLHTADRVFTDALVFVSQIEAEILLDRMEGRIERVKADIERLNKSKSDFISIAAHELKTPLTVIEGYAGMVRHSPQTTNDPTLLACATGISTGLDRLREIVDDLIDVSIIELELLELTFQPVWLKHLFEALERGLRAPLSERQINFMIDYDTVPSYATFADGDRLQQVFYNIVMNAIKYTPDGGHVRVSVRELPGFVDVTVTDTGIGIASENLNRVFDAFSSSGDVSLHSSGKVKFKGSGPGLGLPIARGIIEAHGGSVWVESDGYDEEACPGSTFHILLPMRDQPPDGPLTKQKIQSLE